jgi:hypothetical protein
MLSKGEMSWVSQSTTRPPKVGQPGMQQQVGAKRALKVDQIWLIRFFLDRERRMRDRALLDFAIGASFAVAISSN